MAAAAKAISAPLEGFTITGGYRYDGYGGGMYNDNSSPTVTNCTFSGNFTNGKYGNGGGMYNNNSSPVIANTMFWGNTAQSGKEIYNNGSDSKPTLKNCVVVTSNISENNG